jgi:hypothetical protein
MRSSTPLVARASQMISGGGSPPQQSMRLDGFEDVLVHAGGVTPSADVAALIQNPRPRHQVKFAQPQERIADVLRGSARALLAAGVDVVLRHDATLLQLVEHEPAVGRDGALALVLLEQGETRTLQFSRLRVGRG